jgi:hypothetical protein
MNRTELKQERPQNATASDGLPKVSFGMRSAWKKCQRKVFFRYVAGIEPKCMNGPSLMVGSAFHHGLELWRKATNSQHPERVAEVVGMATEGLRTEMIAKGFADTADLESLRLEAYLRGYFKRYAHDAVRLPGHGAEQTIEGEHDIGVLDGLHYDEATKTATMVEDKTRGDLADERPVALHIDEQVLNYADMLSRSGLHVLHVRVLYRETAKTRTKPNKGETLSAYGARVLGIYTDETNWPKCFREIDTTVDWDEARSYARERGEVDTAIRGKMQAHKLLDGYARNSDQCIGPYGACEFLDACVNKVAPVLNVAQLFKPNGKAPLDGGAFRISMFGTATVAAPAQPESGKKEWWEDE